MDKKSIFKILIIFLLGMAIGAFVMGGVAKHRMDKIHRHHGAKGFSEALVHITGAEGEEKEQLIQLGEKYGDLLKILEKEHFGKRVDLFDALEKEGNVFLGGEAKEQFQYHLHKMKNGPRNKRKIEKD